MWRPGYLAVDTQELPPPPEEKEDTTAADWGTAMHNAKAMTPDASDPWLRDVDPVRAKLWPPSLGVHEQLVAYNCRTGEVVVGPTNVTPEEATAWKEQWGAEYVVGTCDWWASLPTGEPWVDDLKTGWKKPEVVTPQTLFYLMCRCKVMGEKYGRVSITWWPRGKADYERDSMWRQVGPVSLQEFERELQAAWRKATGTNAEARPGLHCQYCPSAGVCPRGNE